MSDTLTGDTEKSMEQPNNDLSKTMGQLAVNSDEILTPPKNLSDMPVDVVPLIIERSDYKEQLILRKVSKSLRELVDKHKPALTRLKISCKLGFIICNYNDNCVAYVSPHWIFSDSRSQITDYHFDTIITKDDYEQVAFDDLVSTLKNPKLQLKEFSFDSEGAFGAYDEYDAEFTHKLRIMQTILKSINHQLSVKKCEINIPHPMREISTLPYLKPGILEKITILDDGHYNGWKFSKETMQKVALLEQWKQAKELELKGRVPNFLKHHITHFKRFHYHERSMDYGKLANIRKFFFSKYENLEFCSISFDIMDDFGVPIPSHHTIPDSEYYLEIKIDDNRATIEKKKIK